MGDEQGNVVPWVPAHQGVACLRVTVEEESAQLHEAHAAEGGEEGEGLGLGDARAGGGQAGGGQGPVGRGGGEDGRYQHRGAG